MLIFLSHRVIFLDMIDSLISQFNRLSILENTFVNVPLNVKGAVIGHKGRTIKVRFFF